MTRPAGPARLSPDWARHRTRVEGHFRDGAGRWTHLTGDGPVSRIRATVRAGRERMRTTLSSWLPGDLSGMRILDAGCGPGVFSLELARRGARVLGVDLADELVEVARERAAVTDLPPHVPRPEFRAQDFVEAATGDAEGFDYVVAMDCLIHYPLRETLDALRTVEGSVRRGVILTVAPWTPLLAVMHAVGKILPHGDRAPGIVPVRDGPLRRGLSGPFGPTGLTLGRTHTVHSGFYVSRGVELRRRGGHHEGS